jgi:hypothetical protein
MTARVKKDFIDVFLDYLTKEVDYTVIKCPWQEGHPKTMVVRDSHYFCYSCGCFGAEESLHTRLKTEKKTTFKKWSKL